MLNDEYNLFLPPEHLANKGRENWNKNEADEYKEWLLNSMEDRINNLLVYLNEKEELDRESFLEKLGKKIEKRLNQDNFFYYLQGKKKLTDHGYALAADIGLLVAKFLLIDCSGRISWKIIRKPKSELAYNLPVLDIKDFNYFDPVGGSIAEANAILNGRRDFKAWKKIYSFWREKAFNLC